MAGDTGSTSRARPEDLISYVGCSASRCGYCGSKDTFESFGIWAHALSPSSYKKLIDRGWRRSGHYVYKPNLARTCCMLYTIRLDADAFVPDKAQRRALNKLNRLVLGDHTELQAGTKVKAGKNKGKPFDLATVVHSTETVESLGGDSHQVNAEHRLTVTLEPAAVTEEGYALYRAYQIAVHKDAPSKLTEGGYKRFLCDSPIARVPIPFASPSSSGSNAATDTAAERRGLPTEYGSYHQTYRLDGALIAVGVLDILPGCVSSVYLMYDPAYAHLSLGRVSACREALLARELQRATMSPEALSAASLTTPRLAAAAAAASSRSPPSAHPDERVRAVEVEAKWHYYMGYYIPTCPKMAYKADYSPSSLADPVSLEWRAIEQYQAVWAQRREALAQERGSGEGDERREIVAGPDDGVDYFVSLDDDGTERPIDTSATRARLATGMVTTTGEPRDQQRTTDRKRRRGGLIAGKETGGDHQRGDDGDGDDNNDDDEYDDDDNDDDDANESDDDDDDDDDGDIDSDDVDDDDDNDDDDNDDDDKFNSIPSLNPAPSDRALGGMLLYSPQLGGALPLSVYRQVLGLSRASAAGDAADDAAAGEAVDGAAGIDRQAIRLHRALGDDVASGMLLILQD